MFIAVSILVSLHLHVSIVSIFNGTNFSEWLGQVQFTLGLLDLDLTLQMNELAIMDESNAEEKYIYKAWERLNILNIMLLRKTVANNKPLPEIENAMKNM